ncbi:MAG: HK97 family phage prohead protease [Shimia thalassica]|uniref:HK97 family phage prohead protease n=1 Tax=Shimia thalassica TaxID=1715693 RepID=UPI0032994CEA
MTERITRTAPASIKSADNDTWVAVLWKTTDGDRHGDAIRTDQFDTSEYRKNPVVLWAHDHTQPIGKATSLIHEGDELRAEFTFGTSAKAREVADNVKAGILNAVSVGFRALSDGVLELLEFSIVSVPANAAALIQRSHDMTDTAILNTPDGKTTVLAAPAKIDNTPRQYVLGKAMAAQAGISGVDAGFENEISQELQIRSGKTDFRVPLSALFQTKAQDTTTPGAGVELTAVSQRDDLFTVTGDAIRPALVTGRAGSRVIMEPEETANVPTMSEGLTPTWQAKDSDAGDTSATFESANVTPKYLGASFIIKRSALQYSAHPDISAILQSDLRRAVASELDRVMLEGNSVADPLEPDGVTEVVTSSGNIDDVATYLAWQTAAAEYDETRADQLKLITRQAVLDNFAQKPMGTSIDEPAHVLGSGNLMGTDVTTSKVLSITGDRAESVIGLWEELMLILFGNSVGVVMNPYGNQFMSGGVQGRILGDANVLVRDPDAFKTASIATVASPAATGATGGGNTCPPGMTAKGKK